MEQRRLLTLEYEHERDEFRRMAESVSIRRKVSRGLCWHPLSVGRSIVNSLNQLVVEVTRTENLDTEHEFEPGKPVVFFSEEVAVGNHEGRVHYFRFTAQVCMVDGNRMVIAMPGQNAVTQIENVYRLGVELYFDEYTYQLMFNALDQVIGAKKGRLAELRDIIHGGQKAEKYTFAPLRFPWLNPSQEQAVNEVLWAKDVAVVHGPPGTGKTTTLVEAVYETLRRETQVMVCAQSNMAVDWIAQKLDDRGLNVMRIGNPTRVTDRMLACTYERRFESHPSYNDLWAVRRNIKQLYDNRGDSSEKRHQKIARLKERAAELEMQINESLFSQCNVIACTLTGSANRLLVGKTFNTLFIDEAAQALEASCWIAMQRCRRVVLAGDHRQLPPTLKCSEAIRGGLDYTMMQAIVEAHPKAVSLLRVQYRMNDTIMQFSNQCFYDGLLESDPSVKNRGILDWERPLEWVDSVEDESFEQLARDGVSRINPAEAELTLRTLRDYFEKITKERILRERIDVGVISPYKGQVYLLRHILKRDPWFKPYRHLVTINTVDGFQGQECDIIVISMVRQNENGEVGFLCDLRRMNVAITRARMKLIVIGHAKTLCHNPFYKLLYNYCQQLKE